MPLLGTLIDVTTLTIPGRSFTSFGHSIGSQASAQPDVAFFQATITNGAAVGLFTRASTAIVWYNSGGTAVQGESVAIYAHSVIR